MKWAEITELHLGQFVLIEAIKASSSNRVRQLEDLTVIQTTTILGKRGAGIKSCISFI